MDYNDFWVLDQVKKLRTEVDYLLSVVGHMVTVISAGGQIMGVSGFPLNPPINPGLAALAADSDTGALYTWSVGSQRWAPLINP